MADLPRTAAGGAAGRWVGSGRLALTLFAAGVLLSTAARASIISIQGSASMEITEFKNGQAGDHDQATDIFPTTTTTLPLQVVAQLVAADGELAAARGAAQFADPRTASTPNPEEFAINLALNSATEVTSYVAKAVTEEKRGVIFEPNELAAGTANGDVVTVEGRLFIDGALAIYAADSTRDLTGAKVTMTVTVDKIVGDVSATVFSGNVELVGQDGGQATVGAAGDFPTDTLILSDLSVVSPDFPAFHVLIIPQLNIAYTYPATVGEEFFLQARVTIDAQNIGDNVGVAGLVGTPVDALRQVIDTTKGESAAAKFVTALQTERESPTGTPAFEQPQTPLGQLCGLFGIGLPLTLAGMIGMKARESRRMFGGGTRIPNSRR